MIVKRPEGFYFMDLNLSQKLQTDPQRWELRSLYLTENIWKSHINTADKDVNMKAILTVINIT